MSNPDKIKNGVENSLPTAENSLPTMEELESLRIDLKERVGKAQAQRLQDIDKKVMDRETLIGEAKNNTGLLEEAKKTLNYYESAEKGGLLGEEDLQKLSELRETVSLLEAQRDSIDKKIEAIYGIPEVGEKIRAGANYEGKKIDKERKFRELKESALKEFDPQIDRLIETLKELDEERKQLEQEEKEKGQALEYKLSGAREIVKSAKSGLDKDSPILDSLSRLSNLFRPYSLQSQSETKEKSYAESAEEIVGESRKSLGFFGKKKEKKALGQLLSEKAKFEEVDDARNAYEPAREKKEEVRKKLFEMPEKCKDIFSRVAETQEELNKSSEGRDRFSLVSYLKIRLEHRVREALDVSRFKDVNSFMDVLEKYEGMYGTTQGYKTLMHNGKDLVRGEYSSLEDAGAEPLCRYYQIMESATRENR